MKKKRKMDGMWFNNGVEEDKSGGRRNSLQISSVEYGENQDVSLHLAGNTNYMAYDGWFEVG